jgi:hypothetical protein
MTNLEEMAARILNPPRAPVPTNSDLDVCKYIAMCTNADDMGQWLWELVFADEKTRELALIALALKVRTIQKGNGR